MSSVVGRVIERDARVTALSLEIKQEQVTPVKQLRQYKM